MARAIVAGGEVVSFGHGYDVDGFHCFFLPFLISHDYTAEIDFRNGVGFAEVPVFGKVLDGFVISVKGFGFFRADFYEVLHLVSFLSFEGLSPFHGLIVSQFPVVVNTFSKIFFNNFRTP